MENLTPKRFELTPLPYKKNALEPYISEQTLHYHHDKHHAAYVDRLNELVEGTPYATMSLCDIICRSEGALFNNAAQAWNHRFYFSQLAPSPKKTPEAELLKAIKRDFGGIDEMIRQMNNQAVKLFGSGWVWLACDKDGKLSIEARSNAGNPMVDMLHPLLAIDVWEHAYYIDHRNARLEGIKAMWQVLDWSVIEARYEKATSDKCCKSDTSKLRCSSK